MDLPLITSAVFLVILARLDDSAYLLFPAEPITDNLGKIFGTPMYYKYAKNNENQLTNSRVTLKAVIRSTRERGLGGA
jgi:hypothetical protein